MPIIAQEDPYMIHLLGRLKYINIVKSATTRWLEGVSLPFHIFFPFLYVWWNVIAWSYCLIVGKIQIHNTLLNLDWPTIHLEFGNIEWPRVNGCLISIMFSICFCCPFCVSCVVNFWLPCLEYVMSETFGFELWNTNSNYYLFLYLFFASQVSLEFFLIHKGTCTFYQNS